MLAMAVVTAGWMAGGLAARAQPERRPGVAARPEAPGARRGLDPRPHRRLLRDQRAVPDHARLRQRTPAPATPRSSPTPTCSCPTWWPAPAWRSASSRVPDMTRGAKDGLGRGGGRHRAARLPLRDAGVRARGGRAGGRRRALVGELVPAGLSPDDVDTLRSVRRAAGALAGGRAARELPAARAVRARSRAAGELAGRAAGGTPRGRDGPRGCPMGRRGCRGRDVRCAAGLRVGAARGGRGQPPALGGAADPARRGDFPGVGRRRLRTRLAGHRAVGTRRPARAAGDRGRLRALPGFPARRGAAPGRGLHGRPWFRQRASACGGRPSGPAQAPAANASQALPARRHGRGPVALAPRPDPGRTPSPRRSRAARQAGSELRGAFLGTLAGAHARRSGLA